MYVTIYSRAKTTPTCRPDYSYVLIAFIAAALLTICGSFACAVLKLLDSEQCKCNFTMAWTLTNELRHLTDVETKLERAQHEWEIAGQLPSSRLWHRVLSTVIVGLSVNQIVAGFAIWISALIIYHGSLDDSNVDLASALSVLSVASQLSVSAVSSSMEERSASLRQYAYSIYFYTLLISTTVRWKNTRHRGRDWVAVLVLWFVGFPPSLFASFSNGKVVKELRGVQTFEPMIRFLWPRMATVFLASLVLTI